MKKFLSILLALAVGFTFTFGSAMSAFAATTTDKDVYLASVDSAKATALESLNAQYEVAKAQIKAKDTATVDKIGEYNVYSEAWLAALDLLYKDIKNAVETKASSLKSVSANPWTEVVYTDITTSNQTVTVGKTLDDVDDAAGMVSAITSVEKYEVVAAKSQFATDKAKYLAAAGTVDTAIYSTTEDTANPYKLTVTKSYTNAKAYADALVADLVSMLDTNTYINLASADTTADAVAAKALAMKALFEDVINYNATTKVYSINEADAAYAVYAEANYNNEYATVNPDKKRKDILSLTEEKVSDQNKAYAIQAAINTEYNKIYNGQDSTGTTETSITAANADAIAAWQVLADAYKVVAEYTGNTGFPEWKVTYTKAKGYVLTETGVTFYIDNVKAVEDTKALVESLKATGKYDEKALDAALKAFTNATYTAMTTKAAALSTSSAAIEACLKASLTDFNKETAKYELSQYVAETANDDGLYVLGITPAYNAETFTVANKTYYAKEWEEIKAAADAYYKAVDAAVNPSDILAAKKAFNNAAYAVKTSDKVVFDNAFNSAVAYANADVQAYITLLNANKAPENQIDASDYDSLGEVTNWFKVNGARTADDVTAMTATLKAEIAALPTAGQLDAKKEAVEKLIAELPGTLVLTFADKAKVVAAYDALVEAKEAGVTTISNEGTLKAVIGKMNELEAKEVEKAYKNIKHGETTTVTIADKADVLAAKEVCDAYVKGYETKAVDGADGMYTYAAATKVATYTTKLGDKCESGSLYNAIRDLEARTLISDIADANENTPAADVAALKDKYTAFVAEYNCVEEEYDAAAVITNADKLDTLAAATKFTDADAKAYVQDLAIAVRTVKSGKKVKVTVNADVQTLLDNGFTVEYKFYKSTKKSSGYKNTVNKTTNTYTNTNPVKGKNYYKVKLVVKNADGTVVATTPLTQCKYGVRTMK